MKGMLIKGLPDLSEDACPGIKKAHTMYFRVKSLSHRWPAKQQNGDLEAGVSESVCSPRQDTQARVSPSLEEGDLKLGGSEGHLLCWGQLGLVVWRFGGRR